MNLKKKFSAKKLYLSCAILVSATANASAPLSQEQALSRILENNPELRVQQAQANAESTSARSALQLPGPEAEGEYMFGSQGAENKWSVGVSQSFDWPGAYSARKRAINADHAAALAEIQNLRRQKALEARLLMAEGVYNCRRLNMLQKLRVNLDSVAHSIAYGYEHGELTILDLKKIRLQMFSLDNEITSCRQAVDQVQSSLRSMAADSSLNVDLSDYVIMPLKSRDEYMSCAENLPQVYASQLRSEAAAASAEASRSSRLPSFSLGYRHAFEEGRHFNGISASIGIPSWGHNHDADAQKLLAEAALGEAASSADQARIAAENDYTNAKKFQALLSGYSKVAVDDEYAELMTMAYQGGQINTITLLQEINFYLEATLDYEAADYAYRCALVRLNALCNE